MLVTGGGSHRRGRNCRGGRPGDGGVRPRRLPGAARRHVGRRGRVPAARAVGRRARGRLATRAARAARTGGPRKVPILGLYFHYIRARCPLDASC